MSSRPPRHTVELEFQCHQALGIHLYSQLPNNGQRFLSSDYRQLLRHLLSEEPFDVIILENLYTFLYLTDIEELSHSTIIMRAHNVEHEI